MAQTTTRPQLAQARLADPAPANLPAVWDLEIYHAMDKRDEALIHDELLNGSGSRAFVYSFPLQGKTVSGISVVGARHLAAEYGGIKHRLISSVERRGKWLIFTCFPAPGIDMRVTYAEIPPEVVGKESDPNEDFYRVLVELQDIKSGNTIQIERQEALMEKRRDGTWYPRPNFAQIAQSKAWRNGVLALIPQTVQIQWKNKMLSLPESVGVDITSSVLDEKRAAVLRFAADKAIPLARHMVEQLTLDQITGLGDAARDRNAAAFAQAAQALGLVPGAEPPEGSIAATGGGQITVGADVTFTAGGDKVDGEAASDQKPADTKKAAATKPKDEKPKEADQAKPATAGREPRFEV